VPRILVVDDEPDGIDLVATILRLAGFEVETVPGGRVAREQLGYATFLRDAGGWPSSRPAVRSTESAHPTTR
jgi:CheY-like chemotaxis protein